MLKNKVFLKKRFRTRHMLVFFIVLFVFILIRKLAVFIILTAITGVMTYFNYHIRLPFDVSPVLFISLILSREIGLPYGIFFVLLAGIIPMVFAGGSFDHTTLFYLGLALFVNYLSSILSSFYYIHALLFLIGLHHTLAMSGSMFFGNDFRKELVNLVLKLAVDSFYILGFSGLLMDLI